MVPHLKRDVAASTVSNQNYPCKVGFEDVDGVSGTLYLEGQAGARDRRRRSEAWTVTDVRVSENSPSWILLPKIGQKLYVEVDDARVAYEIEYLTQCRAIRLTWDKEQDALRRLRRVSRPP